MRYYEFRYLVEGYPQAQAAFIQAGADTAAVQKTIADFKQLVTRNQVKDVNQKNIDWWAKQGWDKFRQFVNQAAAVPSKTQVEKKKLPGQSINLVDNANWFIVIPIDKEASCFHGKNSDWCTTKVHQGYFEKYFYDNQVTLIYCFNKSTGSMWAIAAHKKTNQMEMFDQKDKGLSVEQFQEQTGLDPENLRSMAMGDIHQPKIQDSRDKWKESVALTTKLLNKLPSGTRSPEIEKELIYNKSGKMCLLYIQMIGSIDSKDFPLAIQLVAAGTDGNILQYIKNPKPITEKTAFDNTVDAIEWIENPSPEMQVRAVELDPKLIKYIKNASEEAQLKIVDKNGSFIKNILKSGNKPSEVVQIRAINNSSGHAIIDIIDAGIMPSELVQQAAIDVNYTILKYMLNAGFKPSDDIIIDAIDKQPKVLERGMLNTFEYILTFFKPSNEVQMAAVHKDPYQLQNIIAAGIEPSEDVQKVAVRRLPSLLKDIVDAGITLSKDVQIAAIGDIPDREKKIYDWLESMKFLDQYKSK
jgi:hypothetical protein